MPKGAKRVKEQKEQKEQKETPQQQSIFYLKQFLLYL